MDRGVLNGGRARDTLGGVLGSYSGKQVLALGAFIGALYTWVLLTRSVVDPVLTA